MLFRSRRAHRRALLAAAVCVAAVSLVPAAAQAKQGEQKVKVMSRNLYLGADLTPAIMAGSIPALAAAGTDIWDTVQDTDFPARAKVLAKEIAQEDPDLIGLQEAAHWFTGAPDGIPGLPLPGFPPPTPATTSAINFVDILQQELTALGVPYDIVASQDEANIEGITASGFDIRLLQRDVILAKKSKVDEGTLNCGNVIQGNYTYNQSFTLLGIPNAVTSRRGFVSADCSLKGTRTVRFVNTHLEAFSSTFRLLQAAQLVGATLPSPPFPPPAPAGPASTTALPVVLLGDLNSDPSNASVPDGESVPNNAAYYTVVGAGYADAWTAVNAPTTSSSLAEPGDTSGFNEFVNDPDTSTIDSRIDHVLTRGNAVVTNTKVTGLDPANRTPAGLWPSDHAGVWSKITLP